VAVDGAGNVYIADSGNNVIKEWSVTSQTVSTLYFSTTLHNTHGVAVDGAGNVYIADTLNNAIKEWSVSTHAVSTFASSGLNNPQGVAVDGAGNVYIADTLNNAIKELPRAFVNSTPLSIPDTAGSGQLPPVLGTLTLTDSFAPSSSDQPWLTITGVTGGVVSFSFTANPDQAPRFAHLTLLGQVLTVTQGSLTGLGANALLEGSAAGHDTVVLSAAGPWTASSNAGWLHLDSGSSSGDGNAVVQFSIDADSGPTRSGTLSVAGRTLTVTQAGAGYVSVTAPATLVSSGLNHLSGVAVDGAGNVYIVDSGNGSVTGALEEWSVSSHTVSTLVSSGLSNPSGVAVDGAGNVYIADTDNNAIEE
jgi:hypothetical protein